MKVSIKIFTLVLFFGVSKIPLKAESITIINNSDVDLRVDIVSDPDSVSLCKTCLYRSTYPHGKHSAQVLVPLKCLQNSPYFSVVDMVDGFLGSGACKHLSTAKKYKVTFSSTIFGTRCEAKEI